MSEFKDITVLITAAGNVFMPGTTACLKKNGERKIRLIGADMNDDKSMLNMFDSYYTVPKGTDPTYVDVLLNICKKEKVDIILPIMSCELENLALQSGEFAEIGTVVSVSDLDSLIIANDKLKLFEFMKLNEIPCAKFDVVNSLDELNSKVISFGYPEKPVCIKTTNSSGSRGFRIVDANKSRIDMFLYEKPSSCYITLEDLNVTLSEADTFPTIMVMEYLPGNEYTVDLLASEGNVLYNCCRKSLNMDNSIMLDSLVVDNKEAMTLCETVVNKLGLSGNIGFDIRERDDGTPMIMECNPRITAGIPVFELAGVNLPYLNVKRILGEKLPCVSPTIGAVVKRRWMEMIVEE